MLKMRSLSVSSEEAPSSPESLVSSSPAPSPAPHSDSCFEEEDQSPQNYSPAFRTSMDSSSYNSSNPYPYNTSRTSPDRYERKEQDELDEMETYDETFGCQDDFVDAVLKGDIRNLKRILSRYSQLIQINRLTKDGQTALTQSCLDGNLEMMKVLLAHGASVDLTNRDGFSPLHMACYIGRMDLLSVLVTATNNNR